MHVPANVLFCGHCAMLPLVCVPFVHSTHVGYQGDGVPILPRKPGLHLLRGSGAHEGHCSLQQQMQLSPPFFFKKKRNK